MKITSFAKKICIFLTMLLLIGSFAGCGNTNNPSAASSQAKTVEADSSNTTLTETNGDETDSTEQIGTIVRIGSLKGPTSMGIVSLMDKASKSETTDSYEFNMVTAADELVASVANASVDIALLPANVASILYNKTNGGISVIDINTLGVLYIVSGDTSIASFADLKGKTIYMTGQGTTPDYVFRYLLSANGLTDSDVTLEYKSEPAEVAALLKEQPDAVGLLPQPFATVACSQNENLQIVLDLTKEWDAMQKESGSQLVTGVTIVRNDFLDEHPDAVSNFLTEHKESVEFNTANPDAAANLIVSTGIIEKEPIAKKALPYCNITYIDGQEMALALTGYLHVLFEQDPASVGGTIPEDDFYYFGI